MILDTIITALIAFAVSFALYIVFIPVLRRVKLGQKILEVGPKWHKPKEGTPTMGGLFFITGMVVAAAVMLIFGKFASASLFLPINFAFVLLNAAIGFVDDYVKLFKKRNKGLSAMQKLVLQFILTGLYLASLRLCNLISTTVRLPFFGDTDLGVFYYILIAVVIVFIVNTANLTDGLDGLAGSVAFIIAILFFMFGIFLESAEIYVTEAALVGALIAFLAFNFYPARIFMGDTGSLFLGAMLVACAMRAGRPLLMILIGIVYVIEGLSVMIQVSYFKITHGKRIFKMTPIHHHFELCGMSETAIVAMASAVTVAVSAFAYYLLTAM